MPFKKPGKKQTIIMSIAALIILSGYIFYKVKKHDFLRSDLKDIVKDKTHQLYNVTYDSISVDELGGDLFIKNIRVTGDTVLQKQMIQARDTNAAAAIFDIYIPLLQVVNFKTARALLSKQLECQQVIISNPQVQVYLFPGQAKKEDSQKKQQALYKQILGNFKLIKADSVSVLNSAVVTSDFFTREIKFRTFNTSINLNEVAIDSTYNQDTSRTLFCKQIAIASDRVSLGDKKNTAEILSATFDTRSKVLAFSTLTYDAFKNNGFFKTKLSGISIEGIEWKGPVENSDLIIDKAIIANGELETLSEEKQQGKDTQKKEPRILTGWIQTFALNSLKVKSVTYVSRTTAKKNKPVIIKNNAFSIRQVRIDRTSAFNGKLVNQAKEIELNNDEITVKSGDKLYEYKVQGIILNTKKRSLIIRALKVIPQLSEPAFVKKAHYQTDRFDINFKNIVCKDVDPEKLVKGEIDIGLITTTGNTVKVFRDLSYPVDSISKQGQQMTYPHQIIRKGGASIKINKVALNNTYIEYKEKNPISKNSGRVRFSNTYLTLTNVSSLRPRKDEKMAVTFKTTFLDQIPLTGGFTFSLDQWQKGIFTAHASVQTPINAAVLNQLAEPMGMINVKEGEIKSVKFNMKADTNTSYGTLIMPYENLKISLLKKKGSEYNKKGIASLLANIIVKNNNKEGSNMRTGNVVLTRNRYRSFFNFIWMTIFKGIRDISVLKV